ncbi:unnamed protein product [Dicrocoelium dendriticum]|nr:unnamed protein product [Dicrocoelium dendriticum]
MHPSHSEVEDILAAVEQFLDYYQFRKTLTSFRDESEPFRSVRIQDWRPVENFSKKLVVLKLFRSGECEQFFESLSQLLPDHVTHDSEFQRLEFELNLYFATYSWNTKNAEEHQKAMKSFRQYLETKGSQLSQSTDLLPYYALPYVPNPREHPTYQRLFTDSWKSSIQQKLSSLLDTVLTGGNIAVPRLVKALTDHNVKRDATLRQLTNELSDAEKRASQAQRRFVRLQWDYQTLIGVTADLLDALESSLKGIKLDDGVVQKIYARLVGAQPGGFKPSGATLECATTTGLSLKHHSKIGAPPELTSGTAERISTRNDALGPPLCELDYSKIKSNIQLIDDRRKCYLLQALRWRLTKSTVQQREQCLTSFVRRDLLDLTTLGPQTEVTSSKAPLLACLQSKHHRVREYMARFINALASLCRGRAYLAQNAAVVKILIVEVLKEHDESVTRENFIGALQKMSLRRPMQSIMITMSVIPWIVGLLENADNLSDYTLEYAVALCMNLCLRTAGKKNCIPISARVLKALINMLDSDNMDIVPYVNGALYSILAVPEIRTVAITMGLQSVLDSHIKPNQPEMNKQFEFIIQRLRSNESSQLDESDDELDDEDDEEDASTLESDLDRQDMPPPEAADLALVDGLDASLKDPKLWVGEGLLRQTYAAKPTLRGEANGSVDWCAPFLARDNEARMSSASFKFNGVLQRPTTPGQLSAQTSLSLSRPCSAHRRNVERQSSVNEESTLPLYLRDSLATLSQGFSEADRTPRASLNFEQCMMDNATGGQAPKSPAASKSKFIPTTSSSVGKRSAFESRPKIPRTPEATSPTHHRYSDYDKYQTPDSTVTSTSPKVNESQESTVNCNDHALESQLESRSSKRSDNR